MAEHLTPEMPMRRVPFRLERHGDRFELVHDQGSGSVDRYALTLLEALTLGQDCNDAIYGLMRNAAAMQKGSVVII